MRRLPWRPLSLALLGALLSAPLSGRAQDEEAGEPAEEVEAEVEEEEETVIDPEIFDEALDDFYAEDYGNAAAGFWGYIHFGDQSAENYEWAQFFLGESLRNLGLLHGAVQYYYIVAKTRSQPEILPEALGRLEAISRSRPFSEVLVYEDLLYDSEFGTLPDELDHWVHYVQGFYDYKNGFRAWGDLHFEKVPEKSYYGLKARYVMAVDGLRRRKDDLALALLETIVESEVDAPDIKNLAFLSLARLHFDQDRYEAALEAYGSVVQIDLSFEQAQLLLEKAWANYYLHDHKKAMGLLHALEAPSYEDFFLPDAFMLRGLIFKDLCHFIPAKRVIRSFQFQYGRTLDQMRRRAPMQRVVMIRDGATQDGGIARRTALLRTLEHERRLIEDYDSLWEDVELDKHLRRLYDLEIREQGRLWGLDFRKSADAIALELLEVEEQVNLLDYEIGLDIFKRLKVAEARLVREETLVVPYDSANVYYEFDTEFWNDELHSYEYFINSRCFEKVAGN